MGGTAVEVTALNREAVTALTEATSLGRGANKPGPALPETGDPGPFFGPLPASSLDEFPARPVSLAANGRTYDETSRSPTFSRDRGGVPAL